MIQTVRIRGFKRFTEVTLRLPGHVVLAGPNNTGKTTVLQAIASWSLALRRWRELNDFNPRTGYTYAPIARQSFTSVPLRSFDLLWMNRLYSARVQVEVEIRPSRRLVGDYGVQSRQHRTNLRPAEGRCANGRCYASSILGVVFVPPMTGIGIDEPVFQPPKIEQLLGLGRPGEVLRNLLAEASRRRIRVGCAPGVHGEALRVQACFRPTPSGPHIRAEYRLADADGVARALHFDIASAGSGFQQVLMLLAFLNTRPGAILLLDEPDAHLHIILQDAIYHELKTVAARQRSQLIVATHSEVVINAVEPRELYVMLDEPRAIADNAERNRLISSLRVLSNADVMQVQSVRRRSLRRRLYRPCNILRAWATQLGHRAESFADDRGNVETDSFSDTGNRG